MWVWRTALRLLEAVRVVVLSRRAAAADRAAGGLQGGATLYVSLPNTAQ
jgi:hypothetical protein